MKRIWTAVLTCTCVMVFGTSCQKDGFVQKIESCVDCSYCNNWSWGNGIGFPNDRYYDYYGNYRYGNCEFIVQEDGELTLKYYVSSWGKFSIDGGASFEASHNTEGQFKKFKTPVKKNTKIYFEGKDCKVKNVRILCDSRPTDDDFDDF